MHSLPITFYLYSAGIVANITRSHSHTAMSAATEVVEA